MGTHSLTAACQSPPWALAEAPRRPPLRPHMALPKRREHGVHLIGTVRLELSDTEAERRALAPPRQIDDVCHAVDWPLEP